jgi:hypothetical protein
MVVFKNVGCCPGGLWSVIHYSSFTYIKLVSRSTKNFSPDTLQLMIQLGLVLAFFVATCISLFLKVCNGNSLVFVGRVLVDWTIEIYIWSG